MLRFYNNRGDTLVEVLLAISVLSSIIGIAYTTTNRAQRTTQLVQQRTEATQHASVQLERLRRIRDDPQIDEAKFKALVGSAAFATTGFCIPNTPAPGTPPAYHDSFVAADNAGCTLSSRYKRVVRYDVSKNTLTSTVTWQSSAGAVEQNATLTLRIW